MKALLGILLLVNAALLMWNMGQREFITDEHAPDTEFHPELMKLLPAEKSPSMAKVTINSSATVVTRNDTGSPVEAPEETHIISPSDDSSDRDDASYKNDDAAVNTSAPKPASEEQKLAKLDVIAGQCLFIGPYLTAIDRGRAGRQLQDMKLNFTESEDPEGRPLGYRVYQGPFSTSEDVSRARRRLEKQGIKDLYLMNEGPNLKFISLGFFSNEKIAGQFMQQISKLKVKSKQRLEYATHYWLTVSAPGAIEVLSEKNAIPIPSGISKTFKACPKSQ